MRLPTLTRNRLRVILLVGSIITALIAAFAPKAKAPAPDCGLTMKNVEVTNGGQVVNVCR